METPVESGLRTKNWTVTRGNGGRNDLNVMETADCVSPYAGNATYAYRGMKENGNLFSWNVSTAVESRSEREVVGLLGDVFLGGVLE